MARSVSRFLEIKLGLQQANFELKNEKQAESKSMI
jgi:hypothetical protein